MDYEIDFLPVGDGDRSGDAIAFRYGNLNGSREEQRVVIVDGGFTDDSEALVELVRNQYGTNDVDIVISSHPDQDHVCGLKVVLEELNVGALWMHQPWLHSGALASLRNQSFRTTQLSQKVEASLQGASELEDLAYRQGIPIYEPFTGASTEDGVIQVVGPSLEYYENLLSEICTGETSSYSYSILSKVGDANKGLLPETHLIEQLTDGGSTSPQNNSSVVCLLTIGDRQMLLTADAGVDSLEQVGARLATIGVAPGQLKFIQVPHHGSRKNVGPTVLNQLLGPKGKHPEEAHGIAFVSAAKNASHRHPHKKVTNAFTRRGYRIHVTQGKALRHHHGAPDRPNYSTSTPLPHYTKVEDDGD